MLEVNKIYQGDCLEIIKDIPDKSIDLILTDPPYGINICEWDKPVNIELFYQLTIPKLKENGYLVFFGQMPTMTEWINSANNHKLKYLEHIIWVKRAGPPSIRLNRTFENIFIYGKKRRKFYQNKGRYEDIKVEGLILGLVDIESIKRYIQDLRFKVKTGITRYTKLESEGQKIYKRYKGGTVRSPELCNYTNVWSFLQPKRKKKIVRSGNIQLKNRLKYMSVY